mmetsp:Transcript_21861/g.43414  ORF Transcript_21861/g.43414 Transcript_21861/m.43414 type:complete len:273 (-) Transcript_21861:754-1572(-)
MSLIEHDHIVSAQLCVQQCLSQQHTVRHVLDDCLWRRTVLKSDRVPDLLPKTAPVLFGNTFGNGHRCHSPRLGAPDDAPHSVSSLRHVLSHLGSLPTSCLSNHYQNLIVLNCLQQLISQIEDRQALSLLLDALSHLRAVRHILPVHPFPLRHFISLRPQALECSCDRSLSRIRIRILPRTVHVFRNRVQQGALACLLGLLSLLRKRTLRVRGTCERPIGVRNDLHRRELCACSRGLTLEERRLVVRNLHFEIFCRVRLPVDPRLGVEIRQVV